MIIERITDKSTWDKNLLSQGHFEFLQGTEWGSFQEKIGKKVLFFMIQDIKEKKYPVQVVIHSFLGIFRFATVFRLSSFFHQDVLDILAEYVRKEEKCVFLRVEPVKDFPYTGKFQKKETKNRQWKHTLVLDLRLSDDELLSLMHAKTRYNIRLAEKKEVEVISQKDVDIFWGLNEETKERDKFHSHEKSYYANMLQLGNVYQLTAYYNKQALSSGIFVHYGEKFTYVHGASSNAERNVMAPYLLQWKAIQFAKELGAKEYDFGGIAKPMKEGNGMVTCFHTLCWDPLDKLMGVTRFKAGFGGKTFSYGSAFELVLRPRLYNVFQKIKELTHR